MQSDDLIAAVVLAAGRSERFGRKKLREQFVGIPLIQHTVNRALQCDCIDEIVVVARAGEENPLAGAERVRSVAVSGERAMSVSIATGVGALGDEVASCFIVLGDQPVPAAVYTDLFEHSVAEAADMFVPVYRGQRGNPVLFRRPRFADLENLSGDRGARDLIESNPELVHRVELGMEMPPDLDEPADREVMSRYLVG